MKTWLSSYSAIEFFEDFHQTEAMLLLSQQGISRIGVEPIFYFYSHVEAEDFLQKNPNATLMGYKSYPDASLKATFYHAPKEVWILYKKTYEIVKVGNQFQYTENIFKDCLEISERPQADINPNCTFLALGEVNSSISEEQYFHAIDRIKKDIIDGEYYQANFTFVLKKQSIQKPFEIFKNYYHRNPANYFAYFNLGNISVLSTSPELFIEVDQKKMIARPLKGTLSKKHNSSELLQSEKDLAELNMITDLFRNDFHKICRKQTVEVVKNNSILELEQLYHLYSEIHGILEDKVGLEGIFKAAFPSGSITGCPKIRSQQAIDQYETLQRKIYTGSIGWIQKDKMCLNVAIRTMIHGDGNYYYPVGSGIVYDSQPESEWQECLLKAKTFLDQV